MLDLKRIWQEQDDAIRDIPHAPVSNKLMHDRRFLKKIYLFLHFTIFHPMVEVADPVLCTVPTTRTESAVSWSCKN